MKHALLAAIFTLIALPALAQETYSVPATAGQVMDLTQIVAAHNEQTCERLSLTDACTQAQACTAANAAGGSSCTAAQARAANARIFPATQAGREEFVIFVIVAPRFADLRAGIVGHTRQRFCDWFTNTASQAQRDSVCTNAGRPAGCNVCQ